MNQILEAVMNFINENTTLLIIICVFLIFVLIGYLIDNSIKTKKMEKNLSLENYTENNEEVTSNEVKEETPTEMPAVEEVKTSEEIPSVEKVNVQEESVSPIVSEENEPSSIDTIQSNEITVDPKINEMLLRDFSNEKVEEINNESVEEVNTNSNILPIDELVNNEEIQKNTQEDIPEVKVEKSVYKNDKKLSDIFKKKEENLEKTEDYSKELDRILQKLNEANSNITDDSTLEETTDFTNMF